MSDNSADPFDGASLVEDAFRAAAIKAVQGLVVETHPDFDGKHCVVCIVKVPAVRLKMGKVRCVECQTALEKKIRSYRR